MARILAAVAGTLLLCSACRESVDTRLDIDYPYTVFGILNPKSDTHAVRVFEIQDNIALVRPEPLDATVATTQLDIGSRVAWTDSVVQLYDGDYRHVFWSTFEANAGETYRLEVTRSDGETTQAVTTVPPPVALETLEADTLRPGQAIMPVLIRGNPPAMPRIDVEYILVGFNPGGSDPIFKPLTFNYIGRTIASPDGFVLNIDLRADYLDIYRFFDADNEVTTDIIDLREMTVTVHVGDHQWVSPVDVFDPDYLVEPGAFSNVENGFGFFGSGYTESITFRPPIGLIRRAGFYVIGEDGGSSG